MRCGRGYRGRASAAAASAPVAPRALRASGDDFAASHRSPDPSSLWRGSWSTTATTASASAARRSGTRCASRRARAAGSGSAAVLGQQTARPVERIDERIVARRRRRGSGSSRKTKRVQRIHRRTTTAVSSVAPRHLFIFKLGTRSPPHSSERLSASPRAPLSRVTVGVSVTPRPNPARCCDASTAASNPLKNGKTGDYE